MVNAVANRKTILTIPVPDPVYDALRRIYRRGRAEVALLRASVQDWTILRAKSGLLRDDSRAALQATIIKNYHRVEKGLSLKEPRLGFGQDAIAALLKGVRAYLAEYGHDHATTAAINSLREYLEFNAKRGLAMPELRTALEEFATSFEVRKAPVLGGTMAVSRAEIHRAACLNLQQFFETRHSIREYAAELVSPELIQIAVAMAQKTPSVCNRQAAFVVEVRDKAMQKQVLSYQDGNRGFGHEAGVVLIVGVRLPCFLTVGERHQMWIDGGMFAMSLIYALHSLGLGTCCLNWSVERRADQMLKKTAKLSDECEIIMLMTVGHLRDQFRVTQSPKRPLEEVLWRL